MIRSKHFRCDCNWAFHGLRIEFDDDPQCPTLVISVVNAPKDYSFWRRLHAAIRVLAGREHVLSEVFIHRDELEDFKSFVKEMEIHTNYDKYPA